MATVQLKEPTLAKVREVESHSTGEVRCEVNVGGGHTVVTDEPAERGGTDTATSPLMYFTTSLATCQTVQIIKVAEAMRFKHGAINIKAATTTDMVPGIDGNDKVMRFCAAEMIIDIETDEPEQKVERLKKLSEDRCPVGNIFTDAGYEPSVTWNVLPMKG